VSELDVLRVSRASRRFASNLRASLGLFSGIDFGLVCTGAFFTTILLERHTRTHIKRVLQFPQTHYETKVKDGSLFSPFPAVSQILYKKGTTFTLMLAGV
jgi:hypothetical protein